MGDADVDLTAGRGELESVGEDVEDDLIEILTINPDRQTVGIGFETQGDLLGFRLVFEHIVDIVDESNEVGLLHAHLHHTLVDLTEVHHLVNEVEDALRITFDGEVDIMALRVVILFHE